LSQTGYTFRERTGLSLGGRVTAWWNDRWGLGAAFDYSGVGARMTFPAICQANTICAELAASDVSAYVSLTSVRLLYSPGKRQSNLSFYVLNGPAYVVHGGYRPAALTVSRSTTVGDVLGVGAGLSALGGGMVLRAEIDDYVYGAQFSIDAGSESHLQSDLVLSLGASVKVLSPR